MELNKKPAIEAGSRSDMSCPAPFVHEGGSRTIVMRAGNRAFSRGDYRSGTALDLHQLPPLCASRPGGERTIIIAIYCVYSSMMVGGCQPHPMCF